MKPEPMNQRLLLFSGLITAVVGIMIGIAAAEISDPPSWNAYESELYQDRHRKFAIAGGVSGFLIGMGQDAVRQLKRQRDREEREWHLWHRSPTPSRRQSSHQSSEHDV